MESTKPEMKHKLFCWMDSGRQCGSDCVAFDLKGVGDTTGKYTLCGICNHLHVLCRAGVSFSRFLNTTAKRGVPGMNIPPPGVTS